MSAPLISNSLRKVPKALIFLLKSPSTALTDLYTSARPIFSASALCSGHWKKETPQGGQTELYVYDQGSETLWPDPTLGVLNKPDGKFSLPGHVGLVTNKENSSESKREEIEPEPRNLFQQSDLIKRPTKIENQIQVLYTANDYIQYTKEAEEVVCSGILDEKFPELRGMTNFICELHEAPRLLKKEVEDMFVNKQVFSGSLSVITMTQKTQNDMSVWTNEMEEEREKLTEHFFIAAKEICAKLSSEGHWADFVDPSSGQPYFSPHTLTTMFETDEKYRLLGYRIEDLGCCKVISHRDFGRNVFVGTIFTNAHFSTGVIEEVFVDLQLDLDNSS